MPALSPTMTQGNLASWKKKEGDAIRPGEVLAEIETDKATLDFEATDDGFLAKILVAPGSQNVQVNTALAIVVEDAADIGKFANFQPGAADSASSAPQPSAAPSAPTSAAASSAAPSVAHKVLPMPALSPTMTEGNIASWKKSPGDMIRPGDVLGEIETDKATLDFEATEDGFLAKILVPAGTSKVQVNTPLAIIVESKDDIAAVADYNPGAPSAATPAPAAAATATPAPPASSPVSTTVAAAPLAGPSTTGGRVVASPLARSIAAQKNIDLSAVSGTGPNGRIIRADVEEFAASGAPRATVSAPAPTGGFVDIAHTQMRKIIAQRLSESKQTVPHFYVTVDVNVDELLRLREALNKEAGDTGAYKLSVNDFIIKACAVALRQYPAVNASWTDTAMRQYDSVDISIAVRTDGGLITPIVRNADTKGLAVISNEVKTLVDKARANKLAPHEFQGGTFSISNMGMYGVKHFAAIINPPQSCILAVGAAEKRVVPGSGDSQFAVVTSMAVTLSCDHRVVDGALGAEFLQAVKRLLERPATMLL